MSFSGKRVLVTGGAQGLGRAVVEKFYQAGASVVVLDKSAETLALLKSEITPVSTIQVDLTDWKAVEVAMAKMDALDVLVNNAGVMDFQPALDITENHVDLIFAVNFKAALNASRLFAKQVISNSVKGASIVNVSSIGDALVDPGALAYRCSKAAVTLMTKALALEFAPLGIRVNAVRPGGMLTNLFDHMETKEAVVHSVKEAATTSPIPRVLETSEVADGILFLASDAARMITGEGLTIDGGETLNR